MPLHIVYIYVVSIIYVMYYVVTILRYVGHTRVTGANCSFINYPLNNHQDTRNTLDCDQSNVYSSRDIFSSKLISPNLPLCSFSLCFRSASDPVLQNK